MRGKDMLEAMEYIDDELIEEALSNAVNKTSRLQQSYKKYIYTAAAFAVILGMSAFAYSIFAPSKNTEMSGESGAQTADTSAAEAAEATEITEDTENLQAAGNSQSVGAAADSSATEGVPSTDSIYMSAQMPDNETSDASVTDLGTQPEKKSSTDQPMSAKSKSGNAASEEISDLSETISADTEMEKSKSGTYTIIDSRKSVAEQPYAVYCYAAPEKGEYFLHHYLDAAIKSYETNIPTQNSATKYAYKVILTVFGDIINDNGETQYSTLNQSEDGRQKLKAEYERLLENGYDVSFTDTDEYCYITGIFTKEQLDDFMPQPEYGYSFSFEDED